MAWKRWFFKVNEILLKASKIQLDYSMEKINQTFCPEKIMKLIKMK